MKSANGSNVSTPVGNNRSLLHSGSSKSLKLPNNESLAQQFSMSKSQSTGRILKPALQTLNFKLTKELGSRFCEQGGVVSAPKSKAVLDIDVSYPAPKVIHKTPVSIEAVLKIEKNCHDAIELYEALKKDVKDPSTVNISAMKKELKSENDPLKGLIFSSAGRRATVASSRRSNHDDLADPSPPSVPKSSMATQPALSNVSVPLEARYLSLSHWNFETKNENVNDAYMKVAQSILLREGLLVKMQTLLGNLDSQTWKYSVLRINFLQRGKSLNSESLISKRIYIKQLQNEVAVGLAHLRGITVDILEQINFFRKQLHKIVPTRELVSIFWKNENYLLKMLTDCRPLMDFLVCRMWLGFDASDPILLPPEQHDPSKIYRSRLASYENWLEAYTNLQNVPKPKKKHVRKSNFVTDQPPAGKKIMILSESEPILASHNFSTPVSKMEVSFSAKMEVRDLGSENVVQSEIINSNDENRNKNDNGISFEGDVVLDAKSQFIDEGIEEGSNFEKKVMILGASDCSDGQVGESLKYDTETAYGAALNNESGIIKRDNCSSSKNNICGDAINSISRQNLLDNQSSYSNYNTSENIDPSIRGNSEDLNSSQVVDGQIIERRIGNIEERNESDEQIPIRKIDSVCTYTSDFKVSNEGDDNMFSDKFLEDLQSAIIANRDNGENDVEECSPEFSNPVSRAASAPSDFDDLNFEERFDGPSSNDNSDKNDNNNDNDNGNKSNSNSGRNNGNNNNDNNNISNSNNNGGGNNKRIKNKNEDDHSQSSKDISLDDTVNTLLTADSHLWKELRDCVALSWGLVNGKWEQGEVAAPAFWSDYQSKKPFIVEAAVGFREIFPEIYLIPPTSVQLTRRCLSLARLMTLEIKRMAELLEKSQQNESFQEKLRQKVFENQLEEVKNSIYSEENLKQHYILRYRQEGDNGALNKPLHEQFQSNESSDFLDSLNFSNPLSETHKTDNYDETGGLFALTSTNQSMELRNSVRRFLRIDKSKFEQRLIEKIDGKRDFTSIDEKDGVRTMKNDLKALKTLAAAFNSSESMDGISEKLATILQKYFRRFIARCRVNKLRRLKLLDVSAKKLHKVARGFLGRKKFKRVKRQYMIKSLCNRKMIIRRFRAAITISRFIRFCANKAIIVRDGNNYDIHDQHGHSKISRARYNQVIKEDDSKSNQALNSLNKKKESLKAKSSLRKSNQFHDLIPNLDKYLSDPYEAARKAMAHLDDVKPLNKLSSIVTEDVKKPTEVVEDMRAVLKTYFSS